MHPATFFSITSGSGLFLATLGNILVGVLEHALPEMIPSFTHPGRLPGLSPHKVFIRREPEPGLTSKRGLDKSDLITLNLD